MNRIRPNNRARDMGGRNYGIGLGDGLLGESPLGGGPSPGGPMIGGGGPGPLSLRDNQLALAQSIIQQQQQQLASAGLRPSGPLPGSIHFMQQQQQQPLRPPMGMVGSGLMPNPGGPMMMGMGDMRNDRKRSGGMMMRRDNDGKRGRRDSYGRGEKDRSQNVQDRDRNRSSRSDSDRKQRGEDYDPAEPTEDDDDKKSNLYCHVCSVSVYDEESLKRHLNGMKHKARMDGLASVHQVHSSQLKTRIQAEEHLRNIERNRGRDPDFFCKICNNDLTVPWEKHRYSNIHKQRLLQVRKGCGWCKVHDFTNFTEVLEHRETEQHKKNAELYGTKKDEPKESSQAQDTKKAEDEVVEEEEEEEDLTIPEYNAEVPVGMTYVIPCTGYFCKLCHKFYNKKSAKETHCQSAAHYEKFKQATEVKIAEREKKREELRLKKEEEERLRKEEEERKAEEERLNKDEEDEAMEELADEGEDEENIEENGDDAEEEVQEVDEEGMEDEVDEADESTANVTMESTSFVYMSAKQAVGSGTEHSDADLQDEDAELTEDDKPLEGDAVADDGLADGVASELSHTSLNQEDDDLDLSVSDAKSEAEVKPPAAATKKPSARRGRGRGRAKK